MSGTRSVQWPVVGEPPQAHQFEVVFPGGDVATTLRDCGLTQALEQCRPGLGQRLEEALSELAEHEDALYDFLAVGQKNTEDWAADPIAALTEADPGIPPQKVAAWKDLFREVREVIPADESGIEF